MDVLAGASVILLVVFIFVVMFMVASVMYVLYKAWGPGSLLADYDNMDDPHEDSDTPKLPAAVSIDDAAPVAKTKRKYTRKVRS